MAKVEGTQNVPAALLDLYRATLGEETPKNAVAKRYPFRVPPLQTVGGHPTTKQLAQRARFKTAIADFSNESAAGRARWYAAEPEWGSFLWYYNYFIMSSLGGNANIQDGGAGLIKSIQFKKEEVPTTGGKAFAINTIDVAKTVVMMFGNSFISDKIQRGASTIADGGTNNHALSPEVDPAISEIKISGSGGKEEGDIEGIEGQWANPYAFALIAAQLTVKMIVTSPHVDAGYSWEVIEHKAQTIYPVIVSVAAAIVTIDWAKIPTVASDISIIVIEYI